MLENITETISSLSAIIVAGSAVFAAYLAKRGVRSYQDEFQIKDSYELAKRLSYAVYKLRDGFDHVRNPFFPAQEMDDGNEDSKDHERMAFAYEKRWKVLADAMSNLEAEMTQACVLWEINKKELIAPLRKLYYSLHIAIENRITELSGRNVYTNTEERIAEGNALCCRKEIQKDPFAIEIEKSLQPIEAIARDYLKPDRD